MNINYQLNANELDNNFLEALKKLFQGREIVIHVSDISDTSYLSKIPGMIESIQEGIDEDISECSSLKDIGWK